MLIERLLAAGAKVQAFDPAAMPVAQTAVRAERDVRAPQLRRAGGRGRAGGRHRVERVPGAGLREDAQADEDARSCSTGGTSTPGT
ncbi:MAG: hypothetical protein MZV64_73045 [Ignavibacteriales bacterium]|nr:hypothetical protein [Ignavibacteriales bacterium]